MDRQSLLNCARTDEEKTALAKVLDRAALCEKRREKTFTDFLDAAKAAKFAGLFNKEDFICAAVGGAPTAERKMLGFAPEYDSLSPEDFPITAVAVRYNAKYSKALSHRDFLGAALGLGIDRARLGDILLGEGAVIIAAQEMAEYICANLEQVGRTKVNCEIVPVNFSESEAAENFLGKRMTVASLRLDAVVSGAFNISRAKAAGLIEGEKVFINWACAASGAKTISEGDIVTVRGLGRVRLDKVGGSTKKDRLVVFVAKY